MRWLLQTPPARPQLTWSCIWEVDHHGRTHCYHRPGCQIAGRWRYRRALLPVAASWEISSDGSATRKVQCRCLLSPGCGEKWLGACGPEQLPSHGETSLTHEKTRLEHDMLISFREASPRSMRPSSPSRPPRPRVWTLSNEACSNPSTRPSKMVCCPPCVFPCPNINNNLLIAGIPLTTAAGSQTGVYVGCFTADYNDITVKDLDLPSEYAATGTVASMLSNRVSWFFDFQGPSVTIDTACSSSLVAAHEACMSLKLREISMVCSGIMANPISG